MLKLKKTWLALILTALLLALTLCWTSHAKASDVIHILPGWTATESGYYVTDQAGRDMLAGWSADKAALKVLRDGMAEIRAEIAASAEEQRRAMEQLKSELTQERKQWRAATKRAAGQGLMWGLIMGAVVGAVANR